MRHGRKSQHQRFDGYKLSATATNTQTPLITAVDVAPASEQDGPQAKGLIDAQPAARRPGRYTLLKRLPRAGFKEVWGMSSPASIARHPIHPMLITIPIGLWVFSLVADVIRVADLGGPVWSDVAFYTMAGGIVGALAAAVPGFVDWVSIKDAQTKRIGMVHMLINLTVVALYAVTNGVVVSIPTSGRCGIGVVINGDDGAQYTYCHGLPGSHAVATGDRVTVGQHIMDSASTGNSTGPHLHFAVRAGEAARCPQPFLAGIARGQSLAPATLPSAGCTS